MNPLVNSKARQLKVDQAKGEGDFQFDPAAVCAEMRCAQTVWAASPLTQRLAVIRRFRHLLAEQSMSVAQAANDHVRRPRAEVLATEIIPLAEACRFLERKAASILAPRLVGWRGRPFWLGGVTSRIHREPFGLVLVIAPSNYPIFIPGVQVLQALAAGNSVLLKPGSAGSNAAHEIARLLHAAGLPNHLLHVLPEFPEAAQGAIQTGVDKVFFTGSARTGSKILEQLAPCAIPATMELSGCDAFIIRADADLNMAVRALVFGLRLNDSQTCIAPRRVLVSRSVATEFEGRLSEALAGAEHLRFSPSRREQLSPLLHQALGQGAHLLAGRLLSGGEIIGPVVIAGTRPGSLLLREDIFAPLLCVTTVADDNEAVAITNDCPYALGATIFSRDESAAHSLASRVNAGVVIINDIIAPTADARLPFGGRKFSGFGQTRGAEGLLEMTTTKVVTVHRGRFRPHFDEPQPILESLFLNYLNASHGRGLRKRIAAIIELCAVVMNLKQASSRKKGRNSRPNSSRCHSSKINDHTVNH